MQLKKELGIATVANWVGTAINYGLAFIATPIIVYAFGDIRYGIWSLAMSLTAYYGMIDMGIGSTIVKYYSEYAAKGNSEYARGIINGAFFLYLLLSILILIFLILFIPLIDSIFNIPLEFERETKILFFVTGVTFCVELIGNTFRSIFTGLRKFIHRNIIQSVFSILRVLCIIFFLKNGYGLVVVGLSVLLIDTIKNLVFAFFAFRLSPFLKISYKFFDLSILKKSAKFTLFNFIGISSARVTEKSDLILVGIFFDMKSAAIYSIAESLVRYFEMIPKALISSVLPFSSKLNATGKKEDLLKLGFFLPKYTFSFFLGVLLIATLFGLTFIELWLGDGYELSYEILVLLLFSKSIYISQGILTHLMAGMGLNQYYGILGFIEAVLKIVLSIFLIDRFGIYAIALGGLFVFMITRIAFVPAYALVKINYSRVKYYIEVLIKPVLSFFLILSVNYYFIDNIFWLPFVLFQYLIVFYIFVWKEVQFRKSIIWDFTV